MSLQAAAKLIQASVWRACCRLKTETPRLLPQALQQQKQKAEQLTEQQVGNSQESDSQTAEQQVSVAVHYFPLHVCPLTDTAFVLPACAPATAAR